MERVWEKKEGGTKREEEKMMGNSWERLDPRNSTLVVRMWRLGAEIVEKSCVQSGLRRTRNKMDQGSLGRSLPV